MGKGMETWAKGLGKGGKWDGSNFQVYFNIN